MKNSKSTTPAKEKDCAQTPTWFIDSLESLLGVRFVLDVCANKATAKVDNHFSLDEKGHNGLELPWDSVNWCNPPFSNITPWLDKARIEARKGNSTAVIFPDNTETVYSRVAFSDADTIIRMPFRLCFLKPDGTNFLDKHGKKQSPQFPCCVAWYTPIGLKSPARTIYHDFREYFEDEIKACGKVASA